MVKSNSLLDLDGQKKLFNRYNIDTLDSIDLIYDIIGENTPIGFKIIFDKKYEENRDNFEGINEYTYGTRIDNFDISEITNSLEDLSDEEFAYITRPLFKAISTINPNDEEKIILPKLAEFQTSQSNEVAKRFTPIYKEMLLQDIKSFFFKFSTAALENFDSILDYTNHEQLDDIKRVRDEAYESIKRKYKNNPVASLSNTDNFKFYMFAGNLDKLNDLELDFFHDLVENASMYLDCIQEYPDYYKEEIEDFNPEKYPIKEMHELLDAIKKEEAKRIKEKAPTNKKEKTK